MARATIQKELKLITKNETGLLGRVTSALSLSEVYIIHLLAYSVGDEGYLHVLTKDNAKAKVALEHFIKGIEEQEVVVVEFENKVGTLSPVTKLLGNHGVFIESVYGTSADGFKIVGIFHTSDNAKACELINHDSV